MYVLITNFTTVVLSSLLVFVDRRILRGARATSAVRGERMLFKTLVTVKNPPRCHCKRVGGILSTTCKVLVHAKYVPWYSARCTSIHLLKGSMLVYMLPYAGVCAPLVHCQPSGRRSSIFTSEGWSWRLEGSCRLRWLGRSASTRARECTKPPITVFCFCF